MINLSVKGVDLNEVKRELIRGIHAKDVLAALEAQKVAEQNARIHRLLGGGTRGGSFGEVRMRLPVHVALAWKQREGREVMKDPFWQAYMRRNFPGFFPKTRSAKLESSIVHPGFPKQDTESTEGRGGRRDGGLVDRTGCPLPCSSASVASVTGSERPAA